RRISRCAPPRTFAPPRQRRISTATSSASALSISPGCWITSPPCTRTPSGSGLPGMVVTRDCSRLALMPTGCTPDSPCCSRCRKVSCPASPDSSAWMTSNAWCASCSGPGFPAAYRSACRWSVVRTEQRTLAPQSSRQQRGNASEQRACQWLREQGLELVTQNWRCRLGEIDLIMQHGDTLVFVEVRYRAQDDFGGALASVDQRKQRRLVLAARHYLSRFPQ